MISSWGILCHSGNKTAPRQLMDSYDLSSCVIRDALLGSLRIHPDKYTEDLVLCRYMPVNLSVELGLWDDNGTDFHLALRMILEIADPFGTCLRPRTNITNIGH